ncbi:hypothetical protein ACTWPB_07530 [Nocardia sp. IBHARD005]|uniref:hypothetical protein n=1 Tax=Nocardia sp. IBHARD005 TaxID=3457765 RepID=UPI004059EB72
MTREPVYVQFEEAARRRAERLRNTPPRPTPPPPAPILPPIEPDDEPYTPAMPGLLGWIVALITTR